MRILKRLFAVSLVAFALFTHNLYRHSQATVSALEVDHMGTMYFDNIQDIRNIWINSAITDIEFVATDKNLIEVKYPVYKNKEYEIHVKQVEDRLEITSDHKKHSFSLPDHREIKTIVAVPQNYVFDHADINMDLGCLKFDQFQTETAFINLGMGSLIAHQSNLGKLQAELSMGSMEVEETSIGDGSQINLDMGSLEGSMAVTSGSINIDLSMGSVILAMLQGPYHYETDVKSGSVDIADLEKERARPEEDFQAVINIDLDMGSIEIY